MTILELYFQKTFFNQVWPKLGGSDIPNIAVALGNHSQLSETLWQSLLPAINQYINSYNLQLNTTLKNDSQKFQAIVKTMYQLNKQHEKEGKWYDCWPATAIEKGSTNCSLGSQVLGRLLQQNGYTVEYGMPGPMSHAVIFAKDTHGKTYYLDPANGVIAKTAEELEVDGVKAYGIKTEKEKIPFRLVPVCSLAESIATSVWNLNSLKQAAKYDLQNGLSETVSLTLVARFEVNQDIDYGSWAINHILPNWKNLRDHPIWKQETAESGQKIAQEKTVIH